MVQKLGDIDMDELDVQEIENMKLSIFTEGEQKWLNQAMEYYMKQAE